MLSQLSFVLIFVNVHCFQRKLETLSENFFENLKADPHLMTGDLSASKHFIEGQINNYVKLVTGEEPRSKQKRSLLDQFTKNDQGIYLLSGLAPSATIPVKFPEDVLLFERNSQWFCAALESPSIKENANNLVVFSYEKEMFVEKSRISVRNGTRLAVLNLKNSSLIAVAENHAPQDNFSDKSGIYQFDASGLHKIQSIDMHYASDIVLWRIHNEVYMSIAQFMSNQSGNIHYEIEIPIYKWMGKHFDLVQSVTSKGAKKITHFSVDNANFLAVANFRDDSGNSRIYSDIYKYDYHSEKYELFQRILTRACLDIEIFSLDRNHRKRDTFLVVANSYEKDADGNINYETDSIIYKLIDDSFIPFQSFQTNAVEQWLPVKGFNNEFVLFSSSRFDGVKSFQYDGWSFRETPQKAGNLKGRIRSVNASTIVVSDKTTNGKTFRLEFSHETILSDIYDEMMTWCDHGMKKINDFDVEPILRKAERADIDEEDETSSEIESKIDSLNSLLDEIAIKPETNDTITAGTIILNNITFVNNLNTAKINNLDTNEFFENVVGVDQGFETDQVSFASLIIDDSVSLKTINGRDAGKLIHSTDDVNLGLLKIRGILTVPEGINTGRLNGVAVTSRNLLLREEDQNFSRPLVVEQLQVQKMVAGALNGQNLETLQWSGKPLSVKYIEELRVTNLSVGGYINDVDVATLQKYTLKKSGDQLITSDYFLDGIQGKNLEVFGGISGRKLSELVSTENGNFSITEDLIFENDVFINDLTVRTFLDGIQVENGKLDILLKDNPEEQEITGDKSFKDVIIHHAIYLQGRINSKTLENMNPVVSINDDLFLEGDKIINGVEVEGFVNATDVVTPDGTYSFSHLQSEGLRLGAKEVRPHLFFVQQLNVDELFVDTINGRNPQNFVITGTEQPQIIEAPKIFLSDLSVTGATNALKINNVDAEELDQVLKVEGDQVVVGKHHVKQIIADRISSDEIRFDGNSTIETDLNVDGNFEKDFVKAKTISVKGFVNDLSFDEIVDDAVHKGTKRVIGGHKHFTKITIEDLRVETGLTIEDLPDQFEELRVEGPLNITNIAIENLHFGTYCNGVDRDNFGDDFDQTVDGDQQFDRIVVFGNTYIASNKINDVDIDDLANGTVKVDEPFQFKTVIFEGDVVAKIVNLEGDIENFDFDNVVLPDDLESVIFDEKTFTNLTINGSVSFGAFINGFNMSQFCQFVMGEIGEKNLTVDGNAFFVKGPNVAKINNFGVQNIADKAWFRDADVTVIGSAEFEDIIFKNDVEVGGFVDNISLPLLYENYFSKTKNQNVTATFTFENDLIFESGITVPGITLDGGEVNGINLDEFVRTALLHDYDQVFESVVFFENCYIENLTGEFTVNDLNLVNDVMRYDKVNMVTGTKIFENLNTDHLKLDKNIRIQSVDVLDWFKNSVLKTTNFNITGSKTFKNAIFANGFQLVGGLNGQKFDSDNIMVKNVPQEITGIKTIYTKPVNPVIFKGLKLKGLLNSVEVSDLINNQAYKNQDNIFKTSLNFHNNLTTTNLIIKKRYQGVNMTQLIANVTNLGALNNLLDQYGKLLNMTQKLKESIDGQAYFVHHYKIIQTIPFVSNSKKILCLDGATRIGILVRSEANMRMDLYGWHDNKQQFLRNATIHFREHPRYVTQVMMGRYLYTEKNDGTGQFIRMSPTMDNAATIFTNITTHTISFILPSTNEFCSLFIYEKSPPKVFCAHANEIVLVQTLKSPNASKGSAVTISGTPHLIIVTQPTERAESRIDLWQFSNQTGKFQMHQSMFVEYPKSVSTTYFNGKAYLAIASGHLENAMYSGRVEIRRFDDTLQFSPWQSLELDAPVQVEFAILPSKELVLYVLTANPTEPLLVFRYEGIAGFKLGFTGSALPEVSYMNLFMGGAGQHFIVAQSSDEINVIQAIFKGE